MKVFSIKQCYCIWTRGLNIFPYSMALCAQATFNCMVLGYIQLEVTQPEPVAWTAVFHQIA